MIDWLWAHILNYKISEIHTKTAKLYKKVQPSKRLGENSCEIKCGSHEMASMMLMTINLLMHTKPLIVFVITNIITAIHGCHL